jgi:hypothetical protein
MREKHSGEIATGATVCTVLFLLNRGDTSLGLGMDSSPIEGNGGGLGAMTVLDSLACGWHFRNSKFFFLCHNQNRKRKVSNLIINKLCRST